MSISNLYPSSRPSLLLDFANVGRLDPRVTFARASTARYYDGVTTAKAEENLLLQSQDFTTTWANQGTTDTADAATAPDGTNTADELDDGTGTSPHAITQDFSGTAGTTYTVSAFFKDVDRQYVILACSAGTNTWASAKFDLTAGTAGSTSASGTGWSTTSSSITSVGNSWYRCSITFVSGSTASLTVRIGMATDGTTFTAGERGLESYTGTNATIYIWGAQLEQRSAVTAYTATTTQPITNYVPVLLTAQNNEARFDHTPTTGAALGLLIEEQRTNICLQSEDFSTTWSATRASITSNTIVAPDGTLTGDKFIATSVAGNHSISQTVSVTAQAYTLTCYAKAGEYNFIQLNIPDPGAGGAGKIGSFNLSTGTLGVVQDTGVTRTITPVGNGWYRCSATFTTTGAGTSGIGIFVTNTDVRAESFTGNDYDGVFIWGAQLEAGAFATSYIPTTTTALTRSADAASMTGTNFSDWFNAGEFTVVSSFQRDTTTNAASGGGNSVPRIYTFGTSASSILQLRLFGSTGAEATGPSMYIASSWAAGQVVKHALAYAVNNAALVRDGGSAATDTSVNPFSTVPDMFSIGANTSGTGNIGQGWIQRIAYYPVKLSSAQLQALTG